MALTWRRRAGSEWVSGPYIIQRSQGSYYLMTNPWIGSPVVLGHFDSLAAAKATADRLEAQLSKQ